MDASDRLAALRKFYAPEFVFGVGARHLSGRYALNLGAQRVLLVTDPGVMAAGWVRDVEHALVEQGLSVVVYTRVTPNPRIEEVSAGADLYHSERCNAIVAVGGGSPMDCAKGIGIVVANDRDIREFEGVDEVEVPSPPLVCVPTTAGTSADVSQFAVIADLERRVKFLIVSKKVVPDVALIDPETTTTMSRDLTAITGLDAMTHGLEALASNASSPLTNVHALEALRLVAANLARSVREPDNLEARTGMMLASLEAGLAFSNASLGAMHAMAHSLGGRFDAPHGLCNALLARHVVDFNYAYRPEMYDQAAAALDVRLGGLRQQERRAALLGAIDDLRHAVGVDGTLAKVGASRPDVADLAANAMADACIVTNPRRPDARDLESLYEEAL